jgi:alcohol dehydrogenase class IV
MRYNLPERVESFARIAELLGEEVSNLSDQQAAERAVAAVERIARSIGIPPRIRDLGGKREQLPLFAEKSFAIKRLMNTNPRQPTQAGLLAILEAAF